MTHVRGVEEPDEYAPLLTEWSESIWEAYSDLHEQAHEWIAAARRALEER